MAWSMLERVALLYDHGPFLKRNSFLGALVVGFRYELLRHSTLNGTNALAALNWSSSLSAVLGIPSINPAEDSSTLHAALRSYPDSTT